MRKNEESTVLSLQCLEDTHTFRFKWVGKPQRAIGYLVGALCSILKEVGVDSNDEKFICENADVIKQLIIETLRRK